MRQDGLKICIPINYWLQRHQYTVYKASEFRIWLDCLKSSNFFICPACSGKGSSSTFEFELRWWCARWSANSTCCPLPWQPCVLSPAVFITHWALPHNTILLAFILRHLQSWASKYTQRFSTFSGFKLNVLFGAPANHHVLKSLSSHIFVWFRFIFSKLMSLLYAKLKDG